MIFSYRVLELFGLMGATIIYGFLADPSAFSMILGLTLIFSGFFARVIYVTWMSDCHDVGGADQLLSFRFPMAAGVRPIMTGPYGWMRAPMQAAHFVMGVGIAVASGEFFVMIIVVLISACYNGLQFVIYEQNAKLGYGENTDYLNYKATTPIVNFKMSPSPDFHYLKEISFDTFIRVFLQELKPLGFILGALTIISLFA